MDVDLRELERAVEANPDDKAAVFRLRAAFLRAGAHDRAKPVRVGDRVTVTESADNWVNGSWEGEVLQVLPEGDANIRPVSENPDWRVKPSPEYLATGLYVTKDDVTACTIVRPVMP